MTYQIYRKSGTICARGQDKRVPRAREINEQAYPQGIRTVNYRSYSAAASKRAF